MDIIRFFNDFSILYRTEGHKHCRPGFVNIECPFCSGNPGLHLGYNLENDYWSCWRCGWHPILKTVSTLLNQSEERTLPIIKQYGQIYYHKEVKLKEGKKPFEFPSGVTDLSKAHKHYLSERGFDPDKLERLWGLKSCGPVSKLDVHDYKHRILIPYTWNLEVVTFDTRSKNKYKAGSRYKACPKEREKIEHKRILYGNQEKWKSTGVIVEGPTDVWNLGPEACAVSGIKYTPAQVKVISECFERVFVVFDDDPQAVVQANKLVADLRFRNKKAIRYDIKGDPGGLSEDDAKYLMKQLLK